MIVWPVGQRRVAHGVEGGELRVHLFDFRFPFLAGLGQPGLPLRPLLAHATPLPVDILLPIRHQLLQRRLLSVRFRWRLGVPGCERRGNDSGGSRRGSRDGC